MRTVTLMLKTFWSPGETFKEVTRNRIGPWTPLITLSLVSMIAAGVLFSVTDMGALVARQIEQSPQAANMSQEDREELRQTMERAMANPMIRAASYLQAVVFFPIWIVFVTAVYFALFLLAASTARFLDYFSVTAFAFLPSILASLAGLAVALTVPSSTLQFQQMNVLSPATFMAPGPDETPGALLALAQAISLTTIWTLVLLVIGYGVLNPKVGAAARTAIVLAPWLLIVAARVGLAVAFG